MKAEEFLKQYFINNNIPLVGRKPYCVDFVQTCIYGPDKTTGTKQPLRHFTKKYFPDKPTLSTKVFTYILDLHALKYCHKCSSVFSYDKFYKNQSICKVCEKIRAEVYKSRKKELDKWHWPQKYKENKSRYVYHCAKRRAAKLERTVAWGQEGIKEFYASCPEGYHVDHIIPLQGNLISGLHVLANLQYLTVEENLKKSNKWPF